MTAASSCNLAAGLLAPSLLAGSALAAALVALAYKSKARRLAQQLARERALLKDSLEIGAGLRALSAVEPQCCIVWNDDEPRLVLNTVSASSGLPAKLSQILRFGSWLHPEDAAQIAYRLDLLKREGASFMINASTLERDVFEAAGGVFGAGYVLRFKLFSPVNKELGRVIGENKRLKEALGDRDSLLDALPIPVWLRDKKGALSWVNAAYATAAGARDRDEAISGAMELFEARQRAELSQLVQKQKPGRVRLQTIVNGAVQIYEAIAAPLPRGSGGAALDVAPLAIVEGELERQMAAHSRTLNKVATGVAIFGADKKLVYGNEALARIWRLEESVIREKTSAAEIFDLLRQRRLLPEQPNYRKWRDERILRWDGSRTLDEFWHLPDGRTVKVLTDCRDDGGVTFLFDDVTERLALERQYHSLIDVQAETLDHLSEGIAVFRSDGRLQLFNPAFATIWDLPKALLEDRPHLEQIIAQCQDASADERLWEAARQAITAIPEARETFSGTIERSDQTHLAYAGTPLPDGGTLLTFTDITDSKRIEVVLLERSEALEAADRLKTAFLSHVSYELRTPLTSIIGFTDLLAEQHMGPLNAKQREYLDDIKTSSQVLLTIINDILDLAVIDAGALDLKLAPIPVKEVIEAAELGVRERLTRMKVNLDVHIGEGTETLTADANRLTQVLYNLLSNAIGFSAEGSTITLACRREKNGVAFSVQDTGLGIPEEEQATVFERFETRAHGSWHRGAGLGLSLVKSLVELHKGRIELRSTPGAGTTVTVHLPDRHPALHQSMGPRRRIGGKRASPAVTPVGGGSA